MPAARRPALALCLAALAAAAAAAADAPSFDAEGALERPADYREWVFLSAGLDMFYGPAPSGAARAGRPSVFDNVFVTRAAYQEFMRSGAWPERTMFVLEVRRAESGVSIDNGGRTQGEIVAIEAAVKDSARFGSTPGTNGWGYFNFRGAEGLVARARALPATESCYGCHGANTAVDNTFVQFYPTLLETAKRLGTVKPSYDPNRKL